MPRTTSAWIVFAALAAGAVGRQVARAEGPLDRCSEHWFEQRLDHFRWWPADSGSGGSAAARGARSHAAAARDLAAPAPPLTWRQRYFVCDEHYGGPGSPIWFYAGNEGPVEGYIKSGGLMWENAPAFKAALVWAEHRYYGQSQPLGPDSWKVDPSFLTSRQAMHDYAVLLLNLTAAWGAQESPIIAFGGSYGGMLAAWMRRHYPHIITGAVAASAPVGQFPGAAGFQPSKFWEIVTKSATPEAGAPADCAANVRSAFAALLALAGSEEGRGRLSQLFRLCQPLGSAEEATQLAYWAQGAFDAFGMGAYPFPSSYMGGSDEHPLPAWPMRAACSHLTHDAAWLAAYAAAAAAAPAAAAAAPAAAAAAAPAAAAAAAPAAAAAAATATGFSTASVAPHGARRLAAGGGGAAAESLNGGGSGGMRQAASSDSSSGQQAAGRRSGAEEGDEEWLLAGLRDAAGVLYNATGQESCFNLALEGPAAGNAGPWDYQVCSEFMGQELPYFPATGAADMFWDQGPFDLKAIAAHSREAWGIEPVVNNHIVADGGLDYRFVTNIVFSNGLLDPWSAFGLLERPQGLDESIKLVLIPDGGHHVDLMFSHPEDSEGIKSARQAILAEVRRWVGAPPPSLAADSGRHAAVAAAAAQEASTAVV